MLFVTRLFAPRRQGTSKHYRTGPELMRLTIGQRLRGEKASEWGWHTTQEPPWKKKERMRAIDKLARQSRKAAR